MRSTITAEAVRGATSCGSRSLVRRLRGVLQDERAGHVLVLLGKVFSMDDGTEV